MTKESMSEDLAAMCTFEEYRGVNRMTAAYGGGEYPETLAMRRLARSLAADHGSLVEARCGTDPESRIVLVFQGGFRLPVPEPTKRIDISLMQFGYVGTGPSAFWAFLDESGFGIPYWYLCDQFSRNEILTKGMEIAPPSFGFRSSACGMHPDTTKKLLELYLPPMASSNVHWMLPTASVDTTHEVSGYGDSEQAALQSANANVPKAATVQEQGVVRQQSQGRVTGTGFSPEDARRAVVLPDDAKVTGTITTRKPIRVASWKIRPGQYEVSYAIPAKAVVAYLEGKKPKVARVDYEVSEHKAFLFPCGARAVSNTELVEHSRKHPDEAARHIANGDYEGFLCPMWRQLCAEARRAERDPASMVRAFLIGVDADLKGFVRESRYRRGEHLTAQQRAAHLQLTHGGQVEGERGR